MQLIMKDNGTNAMHNQKCELNSTTMKFKAIDNTKTHRILNDTGILRLTGAPEKTRWMDNKEHKRGEEVKKAHASNGLQPS